MVAFNDEPDVSQERRVRYVSDDALSEVLGQKGGFAGTRLSRQNTSTSSLSFNGGQLQRQRSIDPSLALPIEYRTLSFNINENHDVIRRHAAKVKDEASSELANLDWHTISQGELVERLKTSIYQGLSSDSVAELGKLHGLNVPSPPPTHWFRKIFGYFFGGFGAILLIGGILVMISWKPLGEPNPAIANLALGIVLFIVFAIQAAFNAWQDFSSSRVMASITTMLPEHCMLIRNGNQSEISASAVVPGDILIFKAGSKLPADIRFVEVSSDAKFDRSILTGESMPVASSIDSTDKNYLETRCIGLQGTHCVSGSGKGVVVATGDTTVFGKIAKLTSAPNNTRTTLQKEIFNFVVIIVSLMLFFVILVIIIWAAYLRPKYPGYINVSQLIVSLVSVGIAFVPEGLPIALTMSLTIVAKIMKRNNVLCKSLKTVETLGAVNVICSDKTGTLTTNQMTTTDCSFGTRQRRAEEILESTKKNDTMPCAFKQLAAITALCNAGEFDVTTVQAPIKERLIHGDATDQAILRFSEQMCRINESRSQWRQTFNLAFNSKNKFMIRTFALQDSKGLESTLDTEEASQFAQSDTTLLTIKGGPDVLIGRCTSIMGEDGMVRPLLAEMRKNIEAIKDDWSAHGKRVILLARKVLSANVLQHQPEDGSFEDEITELARTGLTLVGLIAMVDPLRDEIPEVIRTLRKAGIRIFMVTGDFKLTAQAIAIDSGIITTPLQAIDDYRALSRTFEATESKNECSHVDTVVKSIVVSGEELIGLNEHQWSELSTYNEVVFARTTPEQKLRIVKEYQSRGNLVGMTGDGVNDAPSLKAADIGIALGSGSDIAIEAADMVLLDSFGGIVAAVIYGRVVFDNLKKTIAYLLPAGSYSEFWPVLTNIIFGLPQILSSFLMIIVCCFTDCAMAITLAYESPESDVMLRPPRDLKKDKLVDWKLLLQSYGIIGTLETLSSFAMAYWYAQKRGVSFNLLWFGYGDYGDLNPSVVAQVLNEASSIYFVNLVVMQWFTVMALRTRHLSVFQHPPAFNKATQNLYLFPAVIFAVVIIFIFCYIPGLQRTVNTTSVPVEHFFLPMAFGFAILLLDEARKFAVRKSPDGFLAKIAW